MALQPAQPGRSPTYRARSRRAALSIQEAAGTGGTVSLPTPDATGNIAMAAGAGKVALVNTTTALSIACPTGASIIDFVGYGSTANCFRAPGRPET